jgi:N-acetyl-anhydromuramyl-L-alanine amidase AmpD
MAFSLSWLADTLEAAGLKVAEQPGWQTRGISEMGPILGVICHHTAGPKTGNAPSLGIVTNGRPDLSGPLAQLVLGRDGTFYCVAAGRANHAGKGSWNGHTAGNLNFIGIEAENTGLSDDPWPDVQLEAYRHGVAAILKKVGADASMCCGHKEYALPAGRKTDPSFDMSAFRNGLQAIMTGAQPPPAPIPAKDQQNRPTLRRGDTGDLVNTLQAKVSVPASGVFDAATEAAVRAFQRQAGMVADGIVGPKTWAALDAKS